MDSPSGWKTLSASPLPTPPDLVLVFGGNEALKNKALFDEIRSWYGQAKIITASTAGEIIKTEVSDDSLVVTAIKFEKTTLQFA